MRLGKVNGSLLLNVASSQLFSSFCLQTQEGAQIIAGSRRKSSFGKKRALVSALRFARLGFAPPLETFREFTNSEQISNNKHNCLPSSCHYLLCCNCSNLSALSDRRPRWNSTTFGRRGHRPPVWMRSSQNPEVHGRGGEGLSYQAQNNQSNLFFFFKPSCIFFSTAYYLLRDTACTY